jgi:hypothetical protein
MEYPMNKVLAKRTSIPIVISCNWPGLAADRGWKRRAQEHEVHVAGVVGKVNSLHIGRTTASPAGLHTRK